MDQIVIALAGFLTALVTAGVAWKRVSVEARRADLAALELHLQSEALSFSAFLEDWQATSQELSSLISETEIDRILILRAWNGASNPRWTTAVYQMREIGQIPRQYVHFELDADYVARLKKVMNFGPLLFSTDDLPESFIKNVYDAEGVKASLWVHIETHQQNGGDSAAITYASFSTHSEAGMSNEAATRCQIMAGRLKGLAAAFRVGNA